MPLLKSRRFPGWRKPLSGYRKSGLSSQAFWGIKLLLSRLAVFTAVVGSSVTCSLSLLGIEIKIRLLRRHIFRGLEAEQIARSDTLQYATEFGDMAARLFRLADEDRELVAKMEQLGLMLYVECMLYRFRAWRHERVGLLTEDLAETLALGASEEFTAAVQARFDARA